jgi:predicted DNA-binding WGR domain protein
MKHCLFYQDDKSNKFWEVAVKGKEMVVRYGKIATDGQVTVKKFSSASDAETAAEKAMAEKIKKGYHLKGDEKSDEVLVSKGIAKLARSLSLKK